MYEKTRLLDSFCYFCESLHGIMDERRKIEEPVSAEFERFNKDFEASLRSETTRLQSAIDVILNSTGKHVRPLLVLLTAKVCGQVTDNTINSAVLLELLHTATLIHDDVIDETKQRRGVPSLNAIFDNRISVLVGDYVLSTALIRSIQTGDLRIVGIISNLGRDLSEGEIKQLETAEESILDENCYLQVIKKKTATLLSACTDRISSMPKYCCLNAKRVSRTNAKNFVLESGRSSCLSPRNLKENASKEDGFATPEYSAIRLVWNEQRPERFPLSSDSL